MAFNQVLSQLAPATIGTAGQVLVSVGSSASSYWASTIPVSAYSAQFNGAASSYLSIPTNTAFAFPGDFTIECWAYVIDAGRSYDATKVGNFVSDGIAVTIGNSYNFGFTISGGVISQIFFGSDGTNRISITSLSISINTWHHFAVVRSGSTMTLYVDGVSIGTATYATAITSSGTLQIGRSAYVDVYENWVKGFISNVRIVKGLAIYTGNFTVPTSPLGTSQAAGTNIATITPSQVSLLTCNGPGFTDSSPNAFAVTYFGSTSPSQFAPFSSFSAISRSATQTQTVLTSGSGTYYTPSGVAWLRIRMVGAGGGGGGGSNGTTGSSGASTTFGTSFLNAGGGVGGVGSNGNGGAGGTSSIGSGATGIAFTGGAGDKGDYGPYPGGGNGGSTSFGGSGLGGRQAAAVWSGTAGATNSGAGGGGGNVNNSSSDGAAGGGGAGGYVEAYISSPAASYAYTVGAGGGGGTAGNNAGAGGGGGSGVIIVEENYAVNVSGAGSNITRGTAVATTSGTSIDFTGIPSWVKRITIMFSNVSLSGTSLPLVQLGAGSNEITGYVSTGQSITGGVGGANAGSTAGMVINDGGAANLKTGHMILTHMGSNLWISSHYMRVTTAACVFGAGDKTLSGTLDRVRLTTVNGTDTFDSGSVNILYEQEVHMERIEVNVQTNEVKVIQYTPEEEAAALEYAASLPTPTQAVAPTLEELQAQIASISSQIQNLISNS